MKKLITYLLVGAMAASMCGALAGCGGSKTSTRAKSTTAPTTVAATQATTTAQTSETTAVSGGRSSYSADSFTYAGLSEKGAMANAEEAAAGATAFSAVPAFTESGEECWIVGVKKASGAVEYYFVTAESTYPVSDVISGGSTDTDAETDSDSDSEQTGKSTQTSGSQSSQTSKGSDDEDENDGGDEDNGDDEDYGDEEE